MYRKIARECEDGREGLNEPVAEQWQAPLCLIMTHTNHRSSRYKLAAVSEYQDEAMLTSASVSTSAVMDGMENQLSSHDGYDPCED